MKKNILILGAASGVAQAFCRAALAAGFTPVLAARNVERLREIARDLEIRSNHAALACLRFDAADCASHAAFAREALALGPYAGVFVACGVMHEHAAAEAEWQKDAEMIAVNYTGTISILNHLAPLLAGQESSAFLSVITSVAGDRGRPSNFLYGSTKAGLNAYLEGLRARWRGLFIQTVKLGPVDTPMNAGVTRVPFIVSADTAARQILAAISARREVAYVPRKWALIMLVIRLLPRWLFKRMKL